MISRALAVTSCFLMLYGAKCWAIANYGSDTPFGDQWRAEGDLLLNPISVERFASLCALQSASVRLLR